MPCFDPQQSTQPLPSQTEELPKAAEAGVWFRRDVRRFLWRQLRSGFKPYCKGRLRDCKGYIGVIFGFYWDDGKRKRKLLFRVLRFQGFPKIVCPSLGGTS